MWRRNGLEVRQKSTSNGNKRSRIISRVLQRQCLHFLKTSDAPESSRPRSRPSSICELLVKHFFCFVNLGMYFSRLFIASSNNFVRNTNSHSSFTNFLFDVSLLAGFDNSYCGLQSKLLRVYGFHFSTMSGVWRNFQNRPTWVSNACLKAAWTWCKLQDGPAHEIWLPIHVQILWWPWVIHAIVNYARFSLNPLWFAGNEQHNLLSRNGQQKEI